MPENSTNNAEFQWRGFASQSLIEAFEHSDSMSLPQVSRIALEAQGSFAAIRQNPDSSVTLLTDHSGSMPVYYGIKNKQIVTGWSSRGVAKKLGSAQVDEVSAADFILNSTVCYPYTLFKNVYVAPPGAVSLLTFEGIFPQFYFRPNEPTDEGSPVEWGERLRRVMHDCLNVALEGCEY